MHQLKEHTLASARGAHTLSQLEEHTRPCISSGSTHKHQLEEHTQAPTSLTRTLVQTPIAHQNTTVPIKPTSPYTRDRTHTHTHPSTHRDTDAQSYSLVHSHRTVTRTRHRHPLTQHLDTPTDRHVASHSDNTSPGLLPADLNSIGLPAARSIAAVYWGNRQCMGESPKEFSRALDRCLTLPPI